MVLKIYSNLLFLNSKSTNLVFYVHYVHDSTSPQELPIHGAHHPTNVSTLDVFHTATLELKSLSANILPVVAASQLPFSLRKVQHRAAKKSGTSPHLAID